MNLAYLPTSADEMKRLGWDQADIIIVSGDAYVDHPSFGTAIMARLGEYLGMKVAVLPQPNWRDDLRDFKKLGKPRYFFGATAGCMDSMVNHYTARKRLRSDDAYTPGGKAGFRPDYATVVYTRILKKLFPDVPVILGGIEASLRRMTHYDYWSDTLKPSFLIEASADMILYGMAEKAFIKIIQELKNGKHWSELISIPQTVVATETVPAKSHDVVILPSHEECQQSKRTFARMYAIAEKEFNSLRARTMYQKYGETYIRINPPFPPPTSEETDLSFDLPYTRMPHPRYRKKQPIPAFEMIRNSVTIHRGCFGGCSFCAIAAHQGKFISSRSQSSIMRELHFIALQKDFKGHITDLGGPSANMYAMKGFDSAMCEKCKRPSCIFPAICSNLNFDHKPLIALYNAASQICGIKKVTIGSGIRYDMLVGLSEEQDAQFGLSQYSVLLISKHVSGRLKVAPEHVSAKVLNIMRKPGFEKFKMFSNVFDKINKKFHLKQELVLYLIAGHPGSTEKDAEELNRSMKQLNYHIESVQEFMPTPMTRSSVIYYTGIVPDSGKTIYIPKVNRQIKQQKNIMLGKKKKTKS